MAGGRVHLPERRSVKVPRVETLEERLAADLAMSGGTMPVEVLVADEVERDRAARYLRGRRHAALLTLITKQDHEERRVARRAADRAAAKRRRRVHLV